ncbi:MAG TPA: CapA family protein [Bacillota bacterium]
MKDNKLKFTLAATGDILLHGRLYNKAKKSDGSYDFSDLLEHAKPLFTEGDLKIVNQESIIGGTKLGLSSFPDFNSPIEIGYLLKDYDVDIVNLANNHVLDKGKKGLLTSIKNWEKIGIPYVGAYKSKEDQQTLRIFHKNGLRVCFVSYTRNLGMKIPTNHEYLVNDFRGTKILKITKEIRQIKSMDLADVIICSLHFGEEYHMLPTADQKKIAASISDAGADIIIGHHPHVLQPPEYITNSRGAKTFVIYSLGNFFSGQKGLYRQIGAYLTIDIEKKSPSNPILTIDNPKIKLTFVDSSDRKDYKLYLLEDIVDQREMIKTHMGDFDSIEVYESIKNHMKKWIPDLEIS